MAYFLFKSNSEIAYLSALLRVLRLPHYVLHRNDKMVFVVIGWTVFSFGYFINGALLQAGPQTLSMGCTTPAGRVYGIMANIIRNGANSDPYFRKNSPIIKLLTLDNFFPAH